MDSEGRKNNLENFAVAILLAIIALCLGVIVWYFWANFNKDKGQSVNHNHVISFPAVSPTPLSSPAIGEELKVEVLNGSGVSGQASEVAKNLEDAGFKDVATSNAPDADGKQTTTEFKKAVPSDLKQKVIDVLKKDFTNIVSKQASESADFDIIITTGK